MAPTVLVIGAGACGLTAARIFKDAGIDFVVCERRSDLGGLWLYQEFVFERGNKEVRICC